LVLKFLIWQKLFIFRNNIINKKDTIITIFINNKNITIFCLLKLSQRGCIWLKMLIISFSCTSFIIVNSSDKLRRISLQNEFNFSEILANPSFFKYNILSTPYFSIWLRSKKFQGDIFMGARSLSSQDNF
jgi:hypothetical protein